MDTIWFIHLEDKVEGPLSYFDLEKMISLTPDTYVWKEGFETWKKIRDVEELKNLIIDRGPPRALDNPDLDKPDFNDPKGESEEGSESESDSDKKQLPGEDLTLAIKREPPNYLWWLLGLIVIIYFIMKLYFE